MVFISNLSFKKILPVMIIIILLCSASESRFISKRFKARLGTQWNRIGKRLIIKHRESESRPTFLKKKCSGLLHEEFMHKYKDFQVILRILFKDC